MKNPKLLIDCGKVDWELLRAQKLALLEHMDGIYTAGLVKIVNSPTMKALEGILHILDHIQDEAAEILGEEAVFGKPEEAKMPPLQQSHLAFHVEKVDELDPPLAEGEARIVKEDDDE